jgi:predicted DNA-binding helix-hairpin-helix protein
MFPIEVNKADYMTLLRVPGIGQRSAEKIVAARRVGTLSFEDLKKMRVVLKRAKYFILCNGRMYEKYKMERENLEVRLKENTPYAQLSLFDTNPEVFAKEETSKKISQILNPALPDLQASW